MFGRRPSSPIVVALEADCSWAMPARLVNRRWGYEAGWVPLRTAIEQFAAHSMDLQDGMFLEVGGAMGGQAFRFEPSEVRRFADQLIHLSDGRDQAAVTGHGNLNG